MQSFLPGFRNALDYIHPNSILYLCRYSVFILLIVIPSRSLAFVEAEPADNNPSVLDIKLSIEIRKKSLQQVLEMLSSTHGIDFIYIEEHIPAGLTIDVVKGEYKLKDLLDIILKNSGLTYFLIDQQIGLTTTEFSKSVEIDSNKQAKVLTSPSQATPDLKYYKKVQVKSIKGGAKKSSVTTYYFRRSFSFRQEEEKSLSADTLPSSGDTLGHKNTKPESTIRKNLYVKDDYNRALIVKFSIGASYWKLRDNIPATEEDLSRNKYSKSNSFFSLSAMYDYKLTGHLSARAGLGYLLARKDGSHTDMRINSMFTSYYKLSKQYYEYDYSYLAIPVGAAYTIGGTRFSLVFAGEAAINVFLSSDMVFYPVYENQYFQWIDDGNGPYYTKEGDQIVREQAEFKPVVLSLQVSAAVQYKLSNRISLSAGTEVMTFGRSVYRKTAPVRERFSTLGITFGSRYAF